MGALRSVRACPLLLCPQDPLGDQTTFPNCVGEPASEPGDDRDAGLLQSLTEDCAASLLGSRLFPHLPFSPGPQKPVQAPSDQTPGMQSPPNCHRVSPSQGGAWATFWEVASQLSTG